METPKSFRLDLTLSDAAPQNAQNIIVAMMRLSGWVAAVKETPLPLKEKA